MGVSGVIDYGSAATGVETTSIISVIIIHAFRIVPLLKAARGIKPALRIHMNPSGYDRK
jgi:hypothetical protein